jgi:hypothetical protein
MKAFEDFSQGIFRGPVCDFSSVDLVHGRKFAHRSRCKHRIRVIKLREGKIFFNQGYRQIAAYFNNQAPGDTVKACVRVWRVYNSLVDHEQVGVIELGNKAQVIEHHSGINARDIGMDFRQDVIEQVIVMDL